MALYRELTGSERERIRTNVALVSNLLSGNFTFTALQGLYDSLPTGPAPAAEAVDVVGYGFGELLSAAPGLACAWMIDDEYGDDPAIVVAGRSLGCTPLSMIRNRIDDQEAWDLSELASATMATLRFHAVNAGETR